MPWHGYGSRAGHGRQDRPVSWRSSYQSADVWFSVRASRLLPVAGGKVLGISSSGRTCPFRAVLRGAGHAFRLVPLGAVW